MNKNTGVQPVDDGVLVRVKNKDGDIDEGYASAFMWEHTVSTEIDITEWELAESEFPDEERIDVIGSNGGDGGHYDHIPQVGKKVHSVDDTLKERGNRYGEFKSHADLSRQLKQVMAATGGWENLSPPAKEALDMIQHKVARILNGDPNYIDNWRDIQGFARLVEQLLLTTENATDAKVVLTRVVDGRMIDVPN